jgi:GST-like protein
MGAILFGPIAARRGTEEERNMSIVLYRAAWSSAIPVAAALGELAVPHERVTFDLAEGNQRRPEFLKLNPNGKVPTLVVDGHPMFEALAILLWLGDRFGTKAGLWPAADDPLRMQAYSWCSWAYVTYGAQLVRVRLSSGPHVASEMRSEVVEQHAKAQLTGLLQILDQRLSQQAFMLGDKYTLVDLVIGCTLIYGSNIGVPVDAHPHVAAWLAGVRARPNIAQEFPKFG